MILENAYSMTKMRHYIKLNQCFINLRFKIGYDATRVIADIDNCLENFMIAVMTFPNEYKVTTFLQKIPKMYKPSTLYSSFYNNSTTVGGIERYDEMKNIFL